MSNMVYSPIRRLAIRSSGRHRAMLMLRAYFDDSGDSQDPDETVSCIAGCISPLDAWERLQLEWEKVLSDFQVPYLHMKEYAHSEGAYRNGWKGDEEKRKTFLSSLMDIMDRHVMSVIGATVLVEDFKRLTIQQQMQMRDPHFMCLQDVFLAATVHVHHEPAEEMVDIIFSNQSRHVGLTESFFEEYRDLGNLGNRLGAFTWAPFKTTIPLQAADLVAYEVHTFARNLFLDRATPMRTPMKRLFRMMPYLHFFDRNEIVKRFYFNGRGTILTY